MHPDGDPRDDAALLAAHVDGDHEAFGVLFARHRSRLYAVALRTAGDPDLAADALQEGMVAAFRRAGSFRGDAAVTTWLHRVVVNATLDLHRRHAVRAADALPDDDELGRQIAREPGGPASSPVDPAAAVVAQERRTQLLDALRQLPSDQRAALVLVDMEGWSVADAARVLECPPGTVKSRCSRGRARLAELLGAVAQTRPRAPSPRAAPGNRTAPPRVPPTHGATHHTGRREDGSP